jgi:hypothetical protein
MKNGIEYRLERVFLPVSVKRTLENGLHYQLEMLLCVCGLGNLLFSPKNRSKIGQEWSKLAGFQKNWLNFLTLVWPCR